MSRPANIAKPLLFALLLPLQSIATAEETESHGAGHGSEEAAHEHDFHKNLVAAFVGVTTEERREKALTYGIEYARRLSPSFGMGVFLEHAQGDLDFSIAGVTFAYLHDHWKVYAAPGVEYSDEEYNTEFLMRIGVEYSFELAYGFEISPQVDVDFVDGEVVSVVGLTFGYWF